MKEDLSKLEPLYDKTYECAFCGLSFKTKKVRSRFVKPRGTDSDFGPIFSPGESNNPLLYFIDVCPQCGLAFTEDFARAYSQTVKQRIQQEITDKMDKSANYCGERDFAKAVKAYKLAIYSAQVTRERHIAFANVCLRLAWLYRCEGKHTEENRFTQLAAAEFEQSYINSDFNAENIPEMQILYIIGELNRKLGKYNEAVKYFTAVVEHEDRSRYTKYVKLAREQWQLTVHDYRGKKENN